MQPLRLLLPLLPILGVLACTERESPTAPAEPAGPVFSHIAGHKLVNSLADPGDGSCNAAQCTLREAIESPGATTITFAPGLTGTITLAAPAGGGGPARDRHVAHDHGSSRGVDHSTAEHGYPPSGSCVSARARR